MSEAVERARVEDVEAITTLVYKAYRHYEELLGVKPGPLLDDYDAMIRDHSVYVIRDEGIIAALLVLIDKPDVLLLDNVAVDPRFQGRGFGRILINYAISEAKRREYDAIQLYTHEQMRDNQAIYNRFGFKEFDRRTELGLNRVYMKLQWTDVKASSG